MPNLLYIHSDQHNPYVVGCYGDPLVHTPHLDTLAERGVRLDNIYCPSPVCVASRMSMLTGQHPHEIGVWTNDHILDSAVPTFAHAMGAAGYRPVLTGRMHALGTDQLHGYAERPVGDMSSNFPGDGGVPKDIRGAVQESGAGQSSYEVYDEEVTATAVEFINREGVKSRAGTSTDPFCLSVGFLLPHAPYVARREDFDLYREGMTMPVQQDPWDDGLHPFVRWWRTWGGVEQVPDADVLRARAAYWGLVTAMDRLIGRILDALRDNGFEDDTLVIYTSDHGDMVGEHGLWMKRCFYEASVRVPAILSWPGVIEPGSACGRVISSLDINATMLDALGAPPLPRSHGRSLLPLLSDPRASWEDMAMSEYCVYEGWTCRMIRRDEWKLAYYHGHAPQLFNLSDDPDETTDLAADPGLAATRDALVEELLADWDPEAVEERMNAKRRDLALIREWVTATDPPEQFLGRTDPASTYLDDE